MSLGTRASSGCGTDVRLANPLLSMYCIPPDSIYIGNNNKCFGTHVWVWQTRICIMCAHIIFCGLFVGARRIRDFGTGMDDCLPEQSFFRGYTCQSTRH